MKLSDLPSGSSIFIDANVFVYAFAPNLQFGPMCAQLLERIEQRDVLGFCSTHVFSDVARRLMTLEACVVLGWPYTGIAKRLQRHPEEIKKLTRFREAIKSMVSIGVQSIPALPNHVLDAAAISQQHGLLSSDALIVVLMHSMGLAQLASFDQDFDNVSGIVRWEAV